MNDTKNILLAWISSATSIFAAVETRELITVLSAIVLPVLFFTVGKTIDVIVQLHLGRKKDNADRAERQE
ncbi:MAG: hypothetical protein WBO10_02910 [Pyrinomonadaceae bacterium]